MKPNPRAMNIENRTHFFTESIRGSELVRTQRCLLDSSMIAMTR